VSELAAAAALVAVSIKLKQLHRFKAQTPQG
jgi:hypothetical protein